MSASGRSAYASAFINLVPRRVPKYWTYPAADVCSSSPRPQLCPARRGRARRRTAPRARRRRLRQDTGHHPSHRAPARARRARGRRSSPSPSPTRPPAEMRERVAKMLGQEGSGTAARALTVSTFHSFGLGVLQRERSAIGGAFTIFDQGDQTSLVKQLLRAVGADRSYDAQAVIARISNAKNAFQSAAEMPDRDDVRRDRQGDLPAVPGGAAQLQGVRLRRPGVRGRSPLARRRGAARPLAGQVPARPGRRVPGHQPRAARALAAALRRAAERVRGGRRRPGDLRLARGRRAQHPRLRGALPRREGREARAELPLEVAHPVGGERRHR